MSNARPSWDEVLMQTAEVIATRSDISTTKVGAVLALDTRVVSWGYNGYPAGFPTWHAPSRNPEEEVHAEVNAIAWAGRKGIPTEGTTLYCNVVPCTNCAKMIIQAGITRVVTTSKTPKNKERNPSGLSLLERAGVRVDRFVKQ
tara:strand:- start:811 stop:1242 length:432 start_codon:yes stop_codon:yes gene_type:complete